MAIEDDFSVTLSGDIRYTGTTTNYTVLAFHEWLRDIADDETPATADDLVAITSETPSDKSTDNIITLINGFNIDDTAAIHLYDGSITQDDGDTIYAGLVVVGAVETGTQVIIIQDGGLLTDTWSAFPNADLGNNIILRMMVKTREFGVNIDGQRLLFQAREFGDTYGEFAVTMGLGNNTAALFTSVDLNNGTASGTVATWDVFDNLTEGYVLLDITAAGSQEPFYSQWQITGTGTLPASPSINDFYERSKYLQRRGTAETLYGLGGELFRGITHDITYDGLNGTLDEGLLLVWGTEVAYDNELTTPGTVGEYYDFGTSGAKGKLLALDDDGSTGFAIFAMDGTTVVDDDLVTRSDGTADDGFQVNGSPTDPSVSGGRGQILADNGTDRVFIQLLDGVLPVNNLEMHEASLAGVYATAAELALVDTSTAIASRTISPVFVGVSTGSAIIGAYGIGMDITDVTAADQFFDLGNTQRVPPNNVTFTVTGLVSGEDRVLVGPRSGGVLNTTQLLGATGFNANGASVYECDSIPAGTPASGTIRVFTGTEYELVPYTSHDGSNTFTLTGTLSADGASHTFDYDNEGAGPFSVGETLTFGGGGTAELLVLDDRGAVGSMTVRMLTGSDPVNNDSISGGTSSATGDVDTTNVAVVSVGGFVSYIDELAGAATADYTAVHTTDVDLFVRVRDGGGTPIRTFEAPATFVSAAASIAAIRTSDA